jgi:cytochrome b561
VRVYNALPGLSRWKARAVHGTLSTLWVVLSVAGLVVVEQHKLSQDVPLFTTYVIALCSVGGEWSHLARV